MQSLFFIYVGGGLLLALISLPLIAGKIKPNPYYGFRMPMTLANSEKWYATNKCFAKWQLVVALIEVIAATGLYFWPNISVDTYAWAVLGIFIIIFTIAFIQSWRYMKSLS